MNEYDLRARALPVSLVFLPLTFMLLAVLPTNPLVIVVLTAGLPLGAVFSPVGRNWGKSIEKDLWDEWDGPPTTRMLRYCGVSRDRVSSTLRRCVEKVTRVCLPSKEQELFDPAASDAKYEKAIGILRDMTRNPSDFPLVLAANINYGFHRNTLGAKWVGLAVAGISVAITASVLGLMIYEHGIQPLLRQIVNPVNVSDSVVVARAIAFIASICVLLFWTFFVNKEKVRDAADEYARRLIESARALDASKTFDASS